MVNAVKQWWAHHRLQFQLYRITQNDALGSLDRLKALRRLVESVPVSETIPVERVRRVTVTTRTANALKFLQLVQECREGFITDHKLIFDQGLLSPNEGSVSAFDWLWSPIYREGQTLEKYMARINGLIKDLIDRIECDTQVTHTYIERTLRPLVYNYQSLAELLIRLSKESA